MSIHRSRIRRIASVGVALVSVGAMTACGSADGGGVGGSGDEVTVGYVYTKVSGNDLSGAEGGLRATFDHLNKDGGIGGKQVKVVGCNDKNTPDGATSCVQKLLADDSVIAVTSLTLQGAVYARALASSKLAYIPLIPILPADQTKAALALSGGSGAYAPAGLEYLVKDRGAKKLAIFGSSITSVDLMREYTEPVAEKLGVDIVAGQLLPAQGQSDFLPLLARAIDAGADGAYFGFLAPGDYVPFLQAYQAAGAEFPVVGSVASLNPQIIDAFKQANVELIAVGSFGPADGPEEENVKYQEITKEAGVPVSEFGQFGYAGAFAVKALMEQVGADVERTSFYDAASAKDINITPSPIFPGPINRPLADNPQFDAIGNMGAFVGRYVDGKYESLGDPIDSSVYFK